MPAPILLPRVLITNDDGIDAPGLKILAEIAQSFAKEVWIVAPERDSSGAGASLTQCNPVRARQRDERSWAVDGSPADCVALALNHFMTKAPPVLILSGINSAANLGDDNNYSGTVGAALTGLVLGVPSIAISQEGPKKNAERWNTARVIAPKVLQQLLEQGWRKETLLSVNIPDLSPEDITGFSWARQSQKNISGIKIDKHISPRGEDYFWLSLQHKTPVSAPNSDAAILRRGEVAVTALTLDSSIDISRASVTFNEPEPSATDE